VQDASAMFTGDLVECGVAPFLGEASFQDWMQALDRICPYRPATLIPGRGTSAIRHEVADAAIAVQRAYLDLMW
jgi:hypothetical protein